MNHMDTLLVAHAVIIN